MKSQLLLHCTLCPAPSLWTQPRRIRRLPVQELIVDLHLETR